jgi:hypothetical protein
MNTPSGPSKEATCADVGMQPTNPPGSIRRCPPDCPLYSYCVTSGVDPVQLQQDFNSPNNVTRLGGRLGVLRANRMVERALVQDGTVADRRAAEKYVEQHCYLASQQP